MMESDVDGHGVREVVVMWGAGGEAPRTKIQDPEKLQFSSTNACMRAPTPGARSLELLWSLELGSWCFSLRLYEDSFPVGVRRFESEEGLVNAAAGLVHF